MLLFLLPISGGVSFGQAGKCVERSLSAWDFGAWLGVEDKSSRGGVHRFFLNSLILSWVWKSQ
jgi:hypothetical protein